MKEQTSAEGTPVETVQGLPSYRELNRRLELLTTGLNVLGALVANMYFWVIDPLPEGEQALRAPEGVSVGILAAFLAFAFVVSMLWTRSRDR